MISKLQKIKNLLNLHDTQNTKFYAVFVACLLVIIALLIRRPLSHFTTGDYEIFVGWYNYVKSHGIQSFNTDFSNYNPPYTYFLYLVTILPISTIHALKGLLVFFDLVMAFSVYLVVFQLRKNRNLAVAASIGSLFLPTVLANGVLWGQFDQFYVAFILFSLYYILKDNSKLAWLYYGIAIAIKLQAIFFLPVLILMSFKRIKLSHAVYGLLSFIVVTFIPLFAGRSIGSILNIYVAQTNLFNGNLTLGAPNIYQWIPNSVFTIFNNAGIYLTAAVLIIFLIYSVIYKKYSDKDLILVTAIMLFLLPFILPQMHERYLFPATIGSFLVVFVRPKLAWLAITMQVTTLFSYIPFLFGIPSPIPMGILALIGLVMVAVLTREYVGRDKPRLEDVELLKSSRSYSKNKNKVL